MVFCQTKRDADTLAVGTTIKQETHVLHGDIPQDKREMVLQVIGYISEQVCSMFRIAQQQIWNFVFESTFHLMFVGFPWWQV